jgi:hypothetical protein
MSGKSVDAIREGVIRRMEQQAQTIRLVMLGAAAVEALMLGLALYLVDWQQRTHVLLFVFSVLGYTIIVLGLVALGAHVSRVANRIVAALETLTVRG